MALSLCTGRQSPGESVDGNYAVIQDLLRQFQERFGSTNCRVLLGCDSGTPEGQQTFKALELRDKCLDYVEGATQIAASLLPARTRTG